MDNLWKPGWWYTYPFEKDDFVSWDDEIPNGKTRNVRKHQPVFGVFKYATFGTTPSPSPNHQLCEVWPVRSL